MRHGSKQQTLLLIVLTISMLALLASASFILHHYQRYTEASEKLNRVQHLSSQIQYFDEVLTMSARMHAYSGERLWRERYDAASKQLDQAIQEASSSEASLKQIFLETDLLNQKLVALELASMKLVQQGQAGQAVSLLSGSEYMRYKQHYGVQIQQAFAKLNERNEQLKSSHQAWYKTFVTAIMLQALVFVFVWIYLLYFIRNNNQKLNRLITTDELTGLLNRRQFDYIFQRELQRAIRDESLLMLAVLDIDHFKKYNDFYGHPKGDNVLATLGCLLKKRPKMAEENAFRLGGEEFAIVARLNNRDQGKAILQDILHKTEARKIPHKENAPFNTVTFSVGVAFFEPGEVTSTMELYNQADRALYQAKDRGRNQLVEYQQS